MKAKRFIFSLMAMLAMLTGMLQPLSAAKQADKKSRKDSHHSHSTSDKSDKCCKESKKLIKQINNTTMQDLVVDQTTLNIVNQINQTTRADLVVDQETLDIVKHLEDCSCTCTVIMPQDFMDSDGLLSQTYVISEPGSYCLGANIDFDPQDEFTPAFQILADDVRLSLREFTLRQANDTQNIIGVLIGEGLDYSDPDAVRKNIIIQNGNILNFTAAGILAYNAIYDNDPVYTGLSFESLQFSDLNIFECGSSFEGNPYYGSGISLSNLDIFPDRTNPDFPYGFKNVIIEDCTVNHCRGVSAIAITIANNVVVKNTQANDFFNDVGSEYVTVGGGGPAAYYITADNLMMYNCQGNGTKDLDPTNTNGQVGSFLQDCINAYIKDCQFNDTFGESDGIINFNCSNSKNFVAENCQFNNSRGGELARLVAGIHMSDSAFQQTEGNGMKFINCQFNGATVSPTNTRIAASTWTVGFIAITLRNIEFENCQAANISSDNPNFSSFGFLIGTDNSDPIPFYSNGRNYSFSNCVASDISTSGKKAVGFFMAALTGNRIGEQGELANMVLENCIAERIQSATQTDLVAGIAEAYFLTSATRIVPKELNLFVSNCRVSDVRSNLESPSPLSAGIVAQSVHRPDISNNSVSDCDRGILLTGTDQITPSDLFQLAASKADALAFVPVYIDLTSIPAATPAQTFTNLEASRGGPVSISPSTTSISLTRDFLFSTPTNLNFSGGATQWKPGDRIVYNNGGGTDIGGLVSGTTYYLIVYIPGFSELGLIQNNKVDNCSISCYQDDFSTTTSAWVNNTAFNCGARPTQFTNYDITFAGVRPVDAGTLVSYPVGGNKYFNLSLVP